MHYACANKHRSPSAQRGCVTGSRHLCRELQGRRQHVATSARGEIIIRGGACQNGPCRALHDVNSRGCAIRDTQPEQEIEEILTVQNAAHVGLQLHAPPEL